MKRFEILLIILLCIACTQEEITAWCAIHSVYEPIEDLCNIIDTSESSSSCETNIEDTPEILATDLDDRYAISTKVDWIHVRIAQSSDDNCGHKIKIPGDSVVDELGVVKWEFKNISNDYLLVHNKEIDGDSTTIWYKQVKQPLLDYPSAGPFISCNGGNIPDLPNHYTRHTILTECDDTDIGDKYGYFAIENN